MDTMGSTEKRLAEETRKWLERLERGRASLRILREERPVRAALENMDSYMRDCRHWLSKGDLVLAFEAVVYAWGIFETLERMGFLDVRKD
jgi:hypothetical protein